jgi:hypothetical protein
MAQPVGFCNGGAMPPPSQGLTFTARAPGDNLQQSSDKPANNAGYKGMPTWRNIFVWLQPFLAAVLGTPASGQIFPRSDGGNSGTGQQMPL